jgi:hypothetical protein
MLHRSREFTAGLWVANADDLADMTVLERFDFEGDGERTILNHGGDLVTSEDEWALADAPVQDGLGGLDVGKEFERRIEPCVGGKGFAQGQDVTTIGLEIGVHEQLSSAQR